MQTPLIPLEKAQQLVKQQKINLPTADLQNGTYILQITAENQQIVILL